MRKRKFKWRGKIFEDAFIRPRNWTPDKPSVHFDPRTKKKGGRHDGSTVHCAEVTFPGKVKIQGKYRKMTQAGIYLQYLDNPRTRGFNCTKEFLTWNIKLNRYCCQKDKPPLKNGIYWLENVLLYSMNKYLKHLKINLLANPYDTKRRENPHEIRVWAAANEDNKKDIVTYKKMSAAAMRTNNVITFADKLLTKLKTKLKKLQLQLKKKN